MIVTTDNISADKIVRYDGNDYILLMSNGLQSNGELVASEIVIKVGDQYEENEEPPRYELLYNGKTFAGEKQAPCGIRPYIPNDEV